MSSADGPEREDAALAALLARAAEMPAGRVETYGPHPDQIVQWYDSPATSGRAPVVLVHGGFFRPTIDRTHAAVMAHGLVDLLGAPVALAEYRRVGGEPAASVADVAAISDLVEARFGAAGLWVGHSAGGTLVLQRAFDEVRPAASVVALAPVADLTAAIADHLGDGAVTAWLGERTAAKPSRYAHLDPVRLAPGLPERWSRVRCVHGADDLTVPPSQSTSTGLPTTVLESAHHYDLIDPASPVWPAVVDLLVAMFAV